ncbi:MAG: haloacid dehalogenase, partial [Planctomycetota bacterium]
MTSSVDFSSVRLLSFDCYGTLIDWERGLLAALAPWRRRVGLGADDEAVLSAFAQAEPQAEEAQPQAPYPDILRDAFDRLAQVLAAPAPTPQERDALAGSVGDWPPFADTTEALRALGRRCQLVVLSNVDRASFLRTQRRLGVEFDAVVTAEDVGAYKPDPRMFEALDAAAEALGAAPEQRLHVAQSLHHDILPARARGLRTCWVD